MFLKYNFSFDHEDLFLKYNKKVYFLIVFRWFKSNKWNFGYPFFKKYQIFFDGDRKIFGLYLNDMNNNNINKFSPWILVFIFAFLFFLTLIILFIAIKKINNNKRKIRANELEDNFVYVPKE